MKQNHPPRHHFLGTCHRICPRVRFRKIDSDKMRHTHSYQEHKEERDSGRNSPFHRRVMFLMLHNHTQYKCRKQHLNMDTSRLSVQLLATEIEYLRSQKYDNRIEQDRFPVLTPVVFIQLLPTGGQQHKHNHHDNNQLPAQSDHHDLERNHQDDRIQIIENSQYLNLLINPTGLQPDSGEHGKQDSR